MDEPLRALSRPLLTRQVRELAFGPQPPCDPGGGASNSEGTPARRPHDPSKKYSTTPTRTCNAFLPLAGGARRAVARPNRRPISYNPVVPLLARAQGRRGAGGPFSEDPIRVLGCRAMTAASPTAQRWIYGPTSDLLLGCGGIYLVALVALPWLLAYSSVSAWETFSVAIIGLLTNTPHYGATLLRVYERATDRRRYLLFSVYLSAAIWLLFVAGLHFFALGSFLVTLYITWSPWHFAGQNYGLSLMFLRRRGIDVPLVLKRLLYASFVFSYALTLLAIHGPTHSFGVAPVPTKFLGGTFDFVSLGLPAPMVQVGLVACGAGYVASLLAAGVLLLRRARSPRDLLPSVLLVATQAVWFSVPAWLQLTGGVEGGRLFISTTWLAIAHSIQYLWISSYYARRAGEDAGLPRYFAKTVLAGVGITTLPAVVFSPPLLGSLPYQAGLATLLFSVVNLHHFMLDGVIWRLRDGPVARVLLRSGGEERTAEPRTPAAGWARRAVWGALVLALFTEVFGIWEMEFGVRRPLAAGNLVRVEAANHALAWIGRESYAVEQDIGAQIARRLQSTGATPQQWEAVRHHFERSLAIYPSVEAWLGLGSAEHKLGNPTAALRSYERALELDPSHVTALLLSGEAWLDLGQPDRARPQLERAQGLAPEDPRVQHALARLARAEARTAEELPGPVTGSATTPN